jgi:hypothetical protein
MCRLLSRAIRPDSDQPRRQSNLATEMGSTINGNAGPAILTGAALPQDIKIGRAGIRRVRLVVAPG